jgi:hypothetical protein
MINHNHLTFITLVTGDENNFREREKIKQHEKEGFRFYSRKFRAEGEDLVAHVGIKGDLAKGR